jgi:Na+-translocating ferredoxin:NAD+ oxidoreductase subunit C
MLGLINILRSQSGRGTFSHGVHPAENKHYTENKPIHRLPFPPELYLLLSQHAGKPSVPLVKPGQEVVRGEPIARADGFMSVPLHAPATGIIKRVDLVPTSKGPRKPALVLQVHPGESQEILYGAPRDLNAMSPKEIIQAVQDAGLVGLGGAAFPTHVKLSPPPSHRVDTILINGCECEPFLTTDHRLMIEHADDLVTGTRLLMRAMGADRGIIGTEDNKMDAAEAMRKACPPDGSITVKVVPTKYPQGAEKMLAKALVDREIPSGGYPSAVGLGVFNVATTAQIGALLPMQRGVIERVVTVTGPGIEKPGNYLVPLGTPLRFILNYLGYHGSAKYLITGGPMMGDTVASLDVPITKGCGGFLVLRPEDLSAHRIEHTFPCISCGKCVEACPMHLNPCHLGKLATRRRYLDMDDYNLFDCFECGCCSYVCPAGIPLVQHFRVSKAMNRKLKAAAQ